MVLSFVLTVLSSISLDDSTVEQRFWTHGTDNHASTWRRPIHLGHTIHIWCWLPFVHLSVPMYIACDVPHRTCRNTMQALYDYSVILCSSPTTKLSRASFSSWKRELLISDAKIQPVYCNTYNVVKWLPRIHDLSALINMRWKIRFFTNWCA